MNRDNPHTVMADVGPPSTAWFDPISKVVDGGPAPAMTVRGPS